MIGLEFVTGADEASFPGTLATINSALQFHPDARVSVVCGTGRPPTATQRRILSACDRVRVIDAGASAGGIRQSPIEVFKAWVSHGLGADCDVVGWIDQGGVLCAPIDDVVARCRESGGLVSDSVDDPSLLLAAAGAKNGSVLRRWAEGGVEPQRLEPLDARLWCPREAHWDSIIDFREGRFVNVSASAQPQRMFHSGVDRPFWSQAHRDLVCNGHALQTYPYVWFLAMLWFGRCGDWSRDPFDYLPQSSRHLLDDLVHFLPQIMQVLPRSRYQWTALSNPMIERVLEGIPRWLTLGSSMNDVMALVAVHPWIRRYVEVGSYEGGSILTLGLRFLGRDIDFYAVESFMGNLNGTVDGAPLPSRNRFLEHLKRFPGLRVRLVPGDSAHAAAFFDDDSLDCVFIDGCHDTWAVLRDIDVWTPKLAHPAIIAGDDYGFDSVYEAVKARFSHVNITQGGSIWWVALQ